MPRMRGSEGPQAAFAKNLREHRKRAGMSQEALWFKTGLHSTEISRLERGVREPRLTTIVRLAKGLGITPSELLSGIR
jgi:transcriptional regulator with XRE-family HTH domain